MVGLSIKQLLELTTTYAAPYKRSLAKPRIGGGGGGRDHFTDDLKVNMTIKELKGPVALMMLLKVHFPPIATSIAHA